MLACLLLLRRAPRNTPKRPRAEGLARALGAPRGAGAGSTAACAAALAGLPASEVAAALTAGGVGHEFVADVDEVYVNITVRSYMHWRGKGPHVEYLWRPTWEYNIFRSRRGLLVPSTP